MDRYTKFLFLNKLGIQYEVASGDTSFANVKNCAQFFSPSPQSPGRSRLPAGHATEVVTSRLVFSVYISKVIRIQLMFLLIVMINLLPLTLSAGKYFNFSGDYFIFSDDDNYLYGSGNISLKYENLIIKGESLYFDIKKMEAVLLGNIEITKDNKTEKFDSFFFKGPPLEYYTELYKDKITSSFKAGKKNKKLIIKKIKLEDLKKGALYYEFKEFHIGNKRKIKAKKVIPYIMGFPSLPFKKFTIKRGNIPEKTMIYPESLNYSGIYGLTMSVLLRARGSFLKGDNTFKFFEKGLFNLGEPKRGVLFSGKNELLINKKKILNLTLLANSDDMTFNMVFEHRKSYKSYKYFISQTISGRKDKEVFYDFKTGFTLSMFRLIVPSINFSHNLKKSYSYGISTPLNLFKKLSINLGLNRKTFKDTFISDTMDFSSSIAFTGNFYNISSSYNISKNFIEASLKKNFSFNFNFNTLSFLNKNIGFDLSTFYMFSEIPIGEQVTEKISPGFTLNVRSSGISLPLGFSALPILSINQIWDNQIENYTDFNTAISLQKGFGNLKMSVDYGIISHYETDSFWVEGYNTKNLKFNINLIKASKYDIGLKFLTGNDLLLESVLFTGKVFFPKKITLSSFLIYYYKDKRLQTMEVFIEKNFRNVFKIQGGYSLALKKFFIKVLTL